MHFFVFKTSLSRRDNPHRKMILSQIEDFLRAKIIEEIQVVRKLHSITLQVDVEDARRTDYCNLKSEQPVQVESDYDYDDAVEVQEKVDTDIKREDETISNEYSMFIQCQKCEKVLATERDLEAHEFLNHSLVGIHISNEVTNSELIESDSEEFMRKCLRCSLLCNGDFSLSLHILADHSPQIVQSVNEILGFNSTQIDVEAVLRYILCIKELLDETSQHDSQISEENKNYFFELYAGDAFEAAESYEYVDDDETIEEEPEQKIVQERKKLPERKSKSSVDLSEDTRAWLRRQITTRKTEVKSDLGVSRIIFRCAYCNVYSSNSAPGFRYHLISKHLKDNNFEDLPEVESNFMPRELPSRMGRNNCVECNLKFKDQKSRSSHQNCHDLFEIIAQDYSFPSCSTCNMLFIDESSLRKHLSQHQAQNVIHPIEVKAGAVILHGKSLIVPPVQTANDGEIGGFAWNCGHCSKRFSKEPACRFHLLMTHAPNFACPIDKRIFSGFKAVSLFCHHLMNKHSELFPNLSFECTFCKMEFPSIYEKLAHMKTCSLKKFKCDHCGKMFFKKAELVNHLRFVSGEIFFPCEMCSKKCETISDLKIHIRSHTKERP